MKKLLLPLFISFLSTAHAEDRALLMGVDHYQNPEYNLTGVSQDLKTMQETARLMGFQAIKVLADKEVTQKNVENTFKSWLIKGVSKKDRVLIYFSGHGSQIPDENGDEADQSDEVLVLHDVKVVEKNKKPTLAGVLIDDDFKNLLAQIPSHNILVVIDSCHSGSATRAADNTVMSRAFPYDGMPSQTKTNTQYKKLQQSNIVTLAAAHDNEESVGNVNGGLFTIGLSNAVKEAAAKKQTLTPSQLRDKADSFIQNAMQDKTYSDFNLFHPQVSGDAKLIDQAFKLGQ